MKVKEFREKATAMAAIFAWHAKGKGIRCKGVDIEIIMKDGQLTLKGEDEDKEIYQRITGDKEEEFVVGEVWIVAKKTPIEKEIEKNETTEKANTKK